jgi:SWIM zinc finger
VPAALAGDHMGLTTGDPRFPIRVIAKSDIISIDDVAQIHEVPGTDKIIVVQGSKGAVYTVSTGRSGNSCTCPGFRFRGSCRHVAAALVA